MFHTTSSTTVKMLCFLAFASNSQGTDKGEHTVKLLRDNARPHTDSTTEDITRKSRLRRLAAVSLFTRHYTIPDYYVLVPIDSTHLYPIHLFNYRYRNHLTIGSCPKTQHLFTVKSVTCLKHGLKF